VVAKPLTGPVPKKSRMKPDEVQRAVFFRVLC
jgi:hypothetical protein